MTPAISVIMLTYNREMLVSHAIESVLAQTFSDFDYIIVDNGSSDRSGAIADEYAERDRRIRVIHRERGSIGGGRNTGLNAARGEYIAFVDDDDLCEPDYLMFLYKLAVDNNADVSICSVTGKEFNDIEIMVAEKAIIELLWRKKYNAGFPTKLIRHSLFKGNLFVEESRYDDIYLMPRILAKANRIAYHGVPKYTANRHDNNNSAWTSNHTLITPKILSEYLSVYRTRTVWLCECYPNSAAEWRYFEWSFMISMVEKVNRLELSACYQIRDNLIAELREHRDEFINGDFTLDFEKNWMELYV